jgi:hypothetical protein
MIFRGREFSTGEMGNFHPALTELSSEALRHFGEGLMFLVRPQSPNLGWSLELVGQLLVAQVAQLRD